MNTVAVLGAGTIGLSWAALYAAHGVHARITDPRSDLHELVEARIPDLAAGLPGTEPGELLARITATGELADAVREVDLVQENGPERPAVKRELFGRVAELAPAHALLASSSSGIMATDIAAELPEQAAARLLIAHPFNPPHLLPLVEIVPGERTGEDTVARALACYRGLGKTPVRLHKETPGFVANRLQSAILREATDLVLRGVVDVAELDTVMRASLGTRYATVGPFESFHLGGGPGGIRHMFEHLGEGMRRRWQELGDPQPGPAEIERIAAQTERAYGAGADAYRTRTRRRDRLQLGLNELLDEQ